MRRALLLVVVILLMPRPAWATPSARLVYARAPDAASCPDETTLRSAVAARFGYDPFFPWAKQTVVVQMWRSDHRYRARVQMVDAQGMAQGTRELASDGDSCSTLFDTTALAISIALDAAAKLEPPPPPEPASPPPGAVPPEPAPAPQYDDQSPPRPSEGPSPQAPGPWRGFAGAALLGSANVAPSLAAGFAAFGEARWHDASLALEARIDAPASMDVAPGGRVTSWIFGAGLVPCGHYAVASLCAVGFLGSLQAWSSNVSSPRADQALFVAAGGRVGLEWPLSDALALRAQLDVLRNVRPAAFQIDTQVWSAPDFLVTAGAGVAVRFP